MSDISLSDAVNVMRPLVRQAEATLKVAKVLDVVASLEKGLAEGQHALAMQDGAIRTKQDTLKALDASLERKLREIEENFDKEKRAREERLLSLDSQVKEVTRTLSIARAEQVEELFRLKEAHQHATKTMQQEISGLENQLAGLKRQKESYREAVLKAD